MSDQNGILIFDKGDPLPELPQGLFDGIPVRSRFGFKIVEVEGKFYWEAGTEADYRASEAQRLGVKAEDVSITARCIQVEPRKCEGGCNFGMCGLAYNPREQLYYCTCFTVA